MKEEFPECKTSEVAWQNELGKQEFLFTWNRNRNRRVSGDIDVGSNSVLQQIYKPVGMVLGEKRW
jgi:hypothetical protein